jgi:DNA-binding CsgD family transcriptional regulator
VIKNAKLLGITADMQLGNISPEVWLHELSGLMGCTGAGTLVWREDDPENNAGRSSEKFKPLPFNWLIFAEEIVRRSRANKSDYLDEIAKDINIDDPFPHSPLHNPNQLIILMDDGPTRSLLILQHDDSHAGWSSKDREDLSAVLPNLRKANELHKFVRKLSNRLNMAGAVLAGAPRAIAVMSPSAHVHKANDLAQKLFNDEDCFTEVDGKLQISNRQIQPQFEKKLAAIRALSSENVSGFIWNRSFTSPKNKRQLQIVLRAFPLDNWVLESTPYDRFVAIFIHTPESYLQASAKDIREFYGLTTAQSRLVANLLKGNSITTAAKQANIKLNTARSHMQSIYTTMGVEGQADLMRLLAATMVNYVPPK